MTFPAKMLNPGEHVVVTTRTHAKALVAPVLVLAVTVGIVVWLSRLVGRVEENWLQTTLGVVVGVVAAVVVGRWSLWPVLLWLTTSYTFTNRRFIKRSGVIAKEGRTIPLNRISGVDFEIGVVDRIFRCGTLVVSDASTDGRVELHDIPRVEQVQLQVAEELHRLSQGDRADDGS